MQKLLTKVSVCGPRVVSGRFCGSRYFHIHLDIYSVRCHMTKMFLDHKLCHLSSSCNNSTILLLYKNLSGIEKSIPRIPVWHHKACRVMTKGDPEGQIFLSYPHRNNGFFFLLPTVFRKMYLFINSFIYFKISFKRSLEI